MELILPGIRVYATIRWILDATSVGLILSDSCTQFDNAKQERIVRLEIRGVQFFVRPQDVELGGVHADVQAAFCNVF